MTDKNRAVSYLMTQISTEERLEVLDRFWELVTTHPDIKVSVVDFALDYFHDRLIDRPISSAEANAELLQFLEYEDLEP